MARIIVLGAGVSGHTAVQYLNKELGKKHEIIVVSPKHRYNWIPSNIWVGVGQMKKEQVLFDLPPLYKKWGIEYHQARATKIYPEGGTEAKGHYIKMTYTGQGKEGQDAILEYDFLINATGPKLNWGATEGLGSEIGHTVSVCTAFHAEHAWSELEKVFAKMKNGEKQKLIIGTGHPMATCHGAAFEYILNVSAEIERRGLQDKAEVVWISNEEKVGNFGIDNMTLMFGGKQMTSDVLGESMFKGYGVSKMITPAIVRKIEKGVVHYENLENEKLSETFDFAMLIPAFTGQGIKAFDKNDVEIIDKVFKPNGFMTVDADYTPKPYTEWVVEDWPSTYQNPTYDNLFAAGIAFAPPHSMSKPLIAKDGTKVVASPPRTGMPSAVSGKAIAYNIIDRIKNNDKINRHPASMGKQGAICIASAKYGLIGGEAVTMNVFPIVPDYKRYPETGRDLKVTKGDIGLAGHWIKHLLHHLFIWKAKGKAFWWLMPE